MTFSRLGRAVVRVPHQEAALAFYRDTLGFTVLHDETVEGFRYLHVGVPGQEGVGLWLMPDLGEQPDLVLYTDDLDATRARLVAARVEVWAERDDHAGRSLHFRDVAGTVIVAAELPAGPVAGSEHAGRGED
jgi:catechol 2,3-dioxygenase-like lactoylglutathione lyase family enzyme